MLHASHLAALVCATAITVVVGGVILLRPLARRLPALLEMMIEQRQSSAGKERSDDGWKQLQALESRVHLLEQQQGSMETVSDSGQWAASSGTVPAPGWRSLNR